MPFGTAAAIAGGIGAAGSIAGAAIGGSAAKSAAQTQANAATTAAQMQLGMFNTIRSDLAPYRAVGTAALPGYYALLGMGTGTGAARPAASIPANPDGTFQATMGGPGSLAVGAGGFTAGGLAGGMGGGMGIGDLTDEQAQQLLQDRPDVMQEFQRASSTGDRNSPVFLQKGLDSPLNYARYWFNKMGGSASYGVPGLNVPYVPAGAGGAGPTGGADAAAGIQSFLENTPGYQFTRDQGMQAVSNALTARGLGGLSGSLGKGLARFVSGLADSTYQTTLGNYKDAVSTGQSAANQTGTFGSNAASNAGQGVIGAGTALASGQVGAANAWAGGLSGAAGGVGNSLLMSRLFGGGSPGMYGGYGTQGAMSDPGSFMGADGGSIPF